MRFSRGGGQLAMRGGRWSWWMTVQYRSAQYIAMYLVDRPQHPKVVAPDFFERESARQHLPEDDAPAKHITLLTVGDPLEHLHNQIKLHPVPVPLPYLRGHPGSATLVVCHYSGLVAGGSKITDFQCDSIVD